MTVTESTRTWIPKATTCNGRPRPFAFWSHHLPLTLGLPTLCAVVIRMQLPSIRPMPGLAMMMAILVAIGACRAAGWATRPGEEAPLP